MKLRQDAWTEENDLLLAETVLRHVREGSTQLNAFEEVGDQLDRTSAACGFRWNSVVRQRYEQALSLARKQRKQRQRMLGTEQTGKKKILYQPLVEPFGLKENMMNTTVQHSESQYQADAATATEDPKLSLDTVILYLQQLRKKTTSVIALQAENELLKAEIQELSQRNQELEKRLGRVQENSSTIQEDYETLINIMNKARQMAMVEDDDRQATKFKMDRNGNLEKLG